MFLPERPQHLLRLPEERGALRTVDPAAEREVGDGRAVFGDLIRRDHVALISTGERSPRKTQPMLGVDPFGVLRRDQVKSTFVSGAGLDVRGGARGESGELAGDKVGLGAMAEEGAILVDSRNPAHGAESFFCETRCFSHAITDSAADRRILAARCEGGWRVTVAGKEE